MLFHFLFIQIFFLPIDGSLHCTGGPKCHMTLNFAQLVPTNDRLRETCSVIEASSCFVHVKVDYNRQKVNISFKQASEELSYPFVDLLTSNPEASIILRYTVKVRMHDDTQIRLNILLQCRTNNQCAEKQLRHFWPRFISLDNRRNSFHELLFPISSNLRTCYDDQTNQIERCSMSDNICWASTDAERKCTQYDEDHRNDFIYSYNKVDRPHKLTEEHVHYTLACHVNNCNNNETIIRLSKMARQFAENSMLMNNFSVRKRPFHKKPTSFSLKSSSSYYFTFSFGLFIIAKNVFFSMQILPL